nr:unnamed protein product [Callosobruchus analis]
MHLIGTTRLDYLDISSNYVKADRSLPFDSTIHTSNQPTGNFSDNSDIDPDYMPVETSDSEQSDVPKTAGYCIQKAALHTPGLDENKDPIKEVQVCRKRELILREKKGRKRVRNTSGWIEVKAKKDLNLCVEHKNRKGKLILAKQMKEPCKEECSNRCREKISQDNKRSLFEEFWKIGKHTRQWDYIARFVKTVDKRQVKNIIDGASKRKFSRKYMLRANNSEIIVCKTMFLNTFGISKQ